MKSLLKKLIKPGVNAAKRLCYTLLGVLWERGVGQNANAKRLASYRNRHRGKRCFLIGAGPSLTAADLDLIAGEYTIGCNMLYKFYGQTKWRPTYYAMTDRVYAKYQSAELAQRVEAPLFVPRSAYVRMAKRPDDTIYVNDVYDYDTYRIRGRLLSYCWLKGSVMLFMIELAVYLGFDEIYLLGVDCTSTYTEKNHHFTDAYVGDAAKEAERQRMRRDLADNGLTAEEMAAHNYRRQIEAYRTVKEFADASGVRICNATRGGALEVFPRIALEELDGIAPADTKKQEGEKT